MRPRHVDQANLTKVVDRQVRNWELARAQHPKAVELQSGRQVADFVAVARMIGVGGLDFATGLGERLGWAVFDREILHAMAGDDQVRARLYEELDERDVGWIEDTMHWLVEGQYRRDDYFPRLSETILAIARQGHAIFLGRGADLILPRDRGLRVYLVAPLEWRVRQHAQRHDLSEALARAEVERIEHERTEFYQRHFGERARHVTRHDLMLNMATFTRAAGIELVYRAAQLVGIAKA